MITVSSHVLDLDAGQPATGLALVLTTPAGSALPADTDQDGRVRWPESLPLGQYRLTFATGEWYQHRGADCFYPEVTVHFHAASERHYHVPLLLNRYGYSTYRGS